MAQILVQISDRMLKDLERVAPATSRKRSRFIQLALQKALMEVEDVATREAYRRMPDEEIHGVDPRVWHEWSPSPPPRPAGKKPRKRT